MGQALTSVVRGGPIRARGTIHINEPQLELSISNDTADPSQGAHLQAVLLSLVITHDISGTVCSDDPSYSICSSSVCTTLTENLPKSCTSLEALVGCVFDTVFHSHPEVAEANLTVSLRDTCPRFTVEATCRRGQVLSTGPYRFSIVGLAFATVIGVSLGKRVEEQPVVCDITVQRRQKVDSKECFPFLGVSTSVRQTFTKSEYSTREALASAIVNHVLKYTKNADDKVVVQFTKPSALLPTTAQVQLIRQPSNIANIYVPHAPLPTLIETKTAAGAVSSILHSVSLSLGSHVGDRFVNIEAALRLLEAPTSLLNNLSEAAQVSVVDTSFMYETALIDVTDQPRSVNCACMIETNLSPMELLSLVKAIETAVGEVAGACDGPPAVDLDILTYDNQLLDTRPLGGRTTLDKLSGELVIPHPRMCAREHVLRPLCDMIPYFVHPACGKSIRLLLDEVILIRNKDDIPMYKVMPFPKYPLNDSEVTDIKGVRVPPTAMHWIVSPTYPTKHVRPPKTHIMAILNVTPDSSSHEADVPASVAHATRAVASGADIIDIDCPHPGPASVQSEQVCWQVIPVIEAIRGHSDDLLRNALLSVGTFCWDLAERAVRAGANCINDVHAFTGPNYSLDDASDKHLHKMRSVARRYGVPVVLVHSRGDGAANEDYSAYAGELIPAIQAELGHKVDKIVRGRGGVRRWLVFVDPGFGFSKPVEGQLALMRDLKQVTASDEYGNALAGYPLLFGASKKSVLGAVLERPDAEGAYKGRKTMVQERGWATVAAVACAVQQGASVVRVHDVAEMRDVVAVASAIWN